MIPMIHFGNFTIETYPFIMGVAWGLAFNLTILLLKRENISSKGFPSFFITIFFTSWLGSKLFFVLNLPPSPDKLKYLFSHLFWLGGGFVFYGGLIFSFLFIIIDHFFIKGPFHNKLKFIIAPLCFAHSLGRIGCFLAGCCYGTPSSLPWNVFSHGHYRHPVQLYEAFFLFGLGVFFLHLLNRKTSGRKMILFYIIFYSFFRFLIEFLRGDKIRGIYALGLSFSQIVSVCLVLGLVCYYNFSTKMDKLR